MVCDGLGYEGSSSAATRRAAKELVSLTPRVTREALAQRGEHRTHTHPHARALFQNTATPAKLEALRSTVESRRPVTTNDDDDRRIN